MANISKLGAMISGSGDLARFIPEPRSKMSSFAATISKVAEGALGAVGGGLVGIDPKYAELIQLQVRVQEQMQQVSLVSNIEKSKHETQMAAVRNVRVG